MALEDQEKQWPRGINFRKLDETRTGIGIHRSQFIAYLMSLEPDSKGWLNFDQIANIDPSIKNGYSHFLKQATIKKRD
jgi:hypothetical protein